MSEDGRKIREAAPRGLGSFPSRDRDRPSAPTDVITTSLDFQQSRAFVPLRLEGSDWIFLDNIFLQSALQGEVHENVPGK
jgi:hypothetical protein